MCTQDFLCCIHSQALVLLPAHCEVGQVSGTHYLLQPNCTISTFPASNEFIPHLLQDARVALVAKQHEQLRQLRRIAQLRRLRLHAQQVLGQRLILARAALPDARTLGSLRMHAAPCLITRPPPTMVAVGSPR